MTKQKHLGMREVSSETPRWECLWSGGPQRLILSTPAHPRLLPSDSSYLACAPQVAEGATLVLIEFVDQ